jgi:hypothetical protein
MVANMFIAIRSWLIDLKEGTLQKCCKKCAKSYQINLHYLFEHDPRKNRVLFAKFRANLIKDYGDFAKVFLHVIHCNLTSVLSKCFISFNIGWIEKCMLWRDLMIFSRICSQICSSRSGHDWLIYRREHCKKAAKSVQKVIGSICIISLNMILAKIGSLIQISLIDFKFNLTRVLNKCFCFANICWIEKHLL